MNARGTHTYTEITSQPGAWAQAVQVVRDQAPQVRSLSVTDYDQVLFTGCGSTYYLALAAAALTQTLTGAVCRALPASELLLYSAGAYPAPGKRTLLVAVSRSGTTTETLRAIEAFKRARRGPIAVVSNYPDTRMATMGDVNVIIPAGREDSVAQTRSFASMYVACAAMAAVWGQQDGHLDALDRLRPVGERLLSEYAVLAKRWGEDVGLNQIFFLGSGPRYGLACEVALKMKEMSLTVVEPFHFLEFRHGPMSMVTPQTLIVGLLSDAARAQEDAVVRQLAGLGGQTLTLAERDADVSFVSGVPELMRGVLYLPVLQLMAFYRSIGKNLDPDTPHNLSKVIELDAV
jgi:glucosamine--fructose-6-phosphate aminotransferase (isomerizing)